MVLPSQSARPTARRGHMFRRRKSSAVKFVVIGAAVLALPAWLIYTMVSGPDTSEGSPQDESTNVAMNQGSSTSSPPIITDPERPNTSTQGRTNEPEGIRNPNLLDRPGQQPRNTNGGTSGSEASPPNESGSGSPSGTNRDSGTGDVTFAELKRVRDLYTEGWRLFSDDPVRAREFLTRAYTSGLLPPEDEMRIRVNLARMNETLVFSPTVTPGDPFAQTYTVRPNDNLSGIVRQRSLLVDHRLIARVNNLRNANNIRLGQQLKLLTGPFHLVVYKSAYRADLYMGDSDDRVFVRSFDVGLGEGNSTPVGTFRVRTNSKLINPEWTNPRTGQRFAADDPKNPIGEYWIGLEGIDAVSRTFEAYGIHGTIEPDSIGKQQSMGCIRMRDEDVAIVYEVLVENASVIEIRP